MSNSPNSSSVGEAVTALREEFAQSHFELAYSEYNGDTYITVHCRTPPAVARKVLSTDIG